MVFILIIVYIILLSLLSFLFIRLVVKNQMKRNLLFYVLVNYILSFSFLIFLFHFKDYILSFINILFLLLNSIFLTYELKNTYDKYKLLSIPYSIYILFIFFIMFDLLLMNL